MADPKSTKSVVDWVSQKLLGHPAFNGFMLSLEECRKIDPSLNYLSDKELEKVRNSLYEIGQIALEDFFNANGSKIPNGLLPDTNKDSSI